MSEDCVGPGSRNKGQSCNRTCKKRTVIGSVCKAAGDCPVGSFSVYFGKRGYRIEFQGETKELIEKLAQDLIDNKVADFVVRICEICVSARGIENKCNSSCGPEEHADDKTENKTVCKVENKEESEA